MSLVVKKKKLIKNLLLVMSFGSFKNFILYAHFLSFLNIQNLKKSSIIFLVPEKYNFNTKISKIVIAPSKLSFFLIYIKK